MTSNNVQKKKKSVCKRRLIGRGDELPTLQKKKDQFIQSSQKLTQCNAEYPSHAQDRSFNYEKIIPSN